MPEPYLPLQSPITELKSNFVARAWALWFQFFASIFKGDPGTCIIRWGTGTPESVITAPVGSVFLRTNGGASTVLYIKESGVGSTGWVAK